MIELTNVMKSSGDSIMLHPTSLTLREWTTTVLIGPKCALDPLVRYDLQNDLREIFRSLGKTAALVTYDMGEASFFGDEVLLLGSGRIVQRDTLDELLHKPSDEYVTRFIRAQRSPGTEG